MLFQLKKKPSELYQLKSWHGSYSHMLKSYLKAVQMFIQIEVKGTTSRREIGFNKKL